MRLIFLMLQSKQALEFKKLNLGSLMSRYCPIVSRIKMNLLVYSLLLLLIGAISEKNHEQCGAVSRLHSVDGQRSIRPFKVVLTCSFPHISVFLNWLVFYDKTCPNQRAALHIMCLDMKTENLIEKVGLHCHHRFGFASTREFNNLWVARTVVLSRRCPLEPKLQARRQ